MALILNKNYKGIPAKYWKILKSDCDYIKNRTLVNLGHYVDKKQRTENINNYLDILAKYIDGVDLTRAEQYNELKKPVYSVNPVTEEQVQINEFVSAQDD